MPGLFVRFDKETWIIFMKLLYGAYFMEGTRMKSSQIEILNEVTFRNIAEYLSSGSSVWFAIHKLWIIQRVPLKFSD